MFFNLGSKESLVVAEWPAGRANKVTSDDGNSTTETVPADKVSETVPEYASLSQKSELKYFG